MNTLVSYFTMSDIFLYGSLLLVAVGLFLVFSQKNIIKLLIGLNVAETGVNILLVLSGLTTDGTAPIISGSVKNVFNMVDPIPQALVLTSIVIGFGVTAFGLALAVRLYEKYETLDINKIRGLRW